ncbi:CNNM transmembrane domain-containing protein [[Candida] zeylanoides]
MSTRKRNALSLTTTVLTKLVFVVSQLVGAAKAIPVGIRSEAAAHQPAMTGRDFTLNMLTSVFLVLAGGVFAGLTLGLMGQDEVYLKVIATSGEPHERKHARKVLRLIGRGKHWVLVTLLLCNVITNETLPIVLDSCLGGGWPAVVASTASIVVFGEIIPQSICVRYGLQVGSMFAPFVLVLMYVMYPIAYPCALLLDHMLGEDHGTVYKKSGLKTLVTLHRTMGVERLNQDEVTIISAVLDLKEKSVSDIMTPIDRVYTMSADAVLDEKTVEKIFNAGFSRIPIHLPGEPMNFIGMLLVRVLISYDPEDALPVSSFPLATLPETSADTSCLNILNYFQEGKSHMIVVSEHPGEPTGALGVLTLEDVIEELIGEEIVDESDVYIDINNNIKRKVPGPLSKRHLTSYLHNLYSISASNSKRNSLEGAPLTEGPVSPRAKAEPVESKTWKPVNPASNPLETNKTFVTIKKPQIDAVVPPPKPANKELGYGAIHVTEAGALRAQKEQQGAATPPRAQSIEVPRDFKESRSYRTGGIIESVVNVQGVHKTIIENVSDDENEENFALLSSYRSSHGSKY